MKSNPAISDFSEPLFWDAKKEELDLEKNASYIIHRVLEYGLWNDWRLIRDYYGIERIGKIATTFRSLRPTALGWISLLSGIPLNKFRCYSKILSPPPSWFY